MSREDLRSPLREELPAPPAELSPPDPETEFRPCDPTQEDSPPPGTDHENPAEELEFTPPGSTRRASDGAAGRSKRLRRVLYAASALLLMLMLFHTPRAATVPALAPVETPAPTPIVYSSNSDIAIVLPTPQPTPEPTPEVKELRFEPVFFRCSAIHYGWLEMENQEDVRAVHLEVWESNLDILQWSYDMTAEEIASGMLQFPVIDGNQIYARYYELYEQENVDQHLELRVTLTLEGPDGTEQREMTLHPSDEQGWGLNYWSADFQPRWEGQVYYPDCFAVRSYESYGVQPRMRMGSYEIAAATGDICVELFIEGKQVPAEDGYVVFTTEPAYFYDENGEPVEAEEQFYYATVVIPRPADAPESGKATFKIYQKLNGYDKIWVTSASVEYRSSSQTN